MKKTILILTIITLLLGGTIFVIYKNNQNSKEEVIDIFKEDKKEEKEESKDNIPTTKVTVDIKGMINNPGVYEVDSNSRVNDVITLAGGLKEGADTSNINLAKIVSDEMTIIIYSTEEVLEKFKQEVCICNCPYIENNACINNNDNNSNLININTATIEELTALTGIGDVKAEAIIKYRNEVGKFKTKEELLSLTIKDISHQSTNHTTYDVCHIGDIRFHSHTLIDLLTKENNGYQDKGDGNLMSSETGEGNQKNKCKYNATGATESGCREENVIDKPCNDCRHKNGKHYISRAISVF